MDQGHFIAIVEDDPEIRDLVVDYLSSNGLRVEACADAARLNRLLGRSVPDLIVLDLMLPGEDGLSICRRLRAKSGIPILILTARADDVDRIVGLELGADDYLAKPFNPRELLARIHAILRRGRLQQSGNRKLHVSDLLVDLDARSVAHTQSGEIALTSAEFDLLECFVTRPGRVLTRDQLMDWTRGRQPDVFDRTIDVQLSRLRKKIERDNEPMIKTVRGQGYIMTAVVADA